jgi:DNA-binding IclR family transcriptional regulator
MGRFEVLEFFRSNPDGFFTIKELSLKLGVTERNIRPCVLYLESRGWISGRPRGNFRNWNREFWFKR